MIHGGIDLSVAPGGADYGGVAWLLKAGAGPLVASTSGILLSAVAACSWPAHHRLQVTSFIITLAG